MELFVFYFLATVITVTAVGVIAFPNPIHSALCLICNLVGVASIFALLQAHFLATVQIIVYAGAIMVLVIFVIMLLNFKVEQEGRMQRLLALLCFIIGTTFFFSLSFIFLIEFQQTPQFSEDTIGTVANIGRLLFTKYLFPFEAASLLIMAAIVGSIMVASTSHKGQPESKDLQGAN